MSIIKGTRETDYDPVIHEIDNPENAIFETTDPKLYAPVVTSWKENDKTFRTIKIRI